MNEADLELATPTPDRDELHRPQLCTTVEGVVFWVRLPRGHHVRCLITDGALERHYGAQAERPDTWLQAFMRHRRDIEARALAASGRRDDVHVVLVNDSLGVLRASAGRCVT